MPEDPEGRDDSETHPREGSGPVPPEERTDAPEPATGAPDDPSNTWDTTAPPSAPLPAAIGRYRILGKLGEGGMGVVYEAEQQQPRRRVALKVVRGGQFVDEYRVRLFQRESETLARLKHPNIGAIYESGRTDDGQHFFAMELVRGDTLGRYLGKRPTPITSPELEHRLHLFRQVCDAVHYAHQRGVIHRDLKPSNIVLTEEVSSPPPPAATASRSPSDRPSSPSTRDGPLPQVKILDFGLARITEGDLQASTLLTEVGMIKGTLPYMSPEQARGNPDDIDHRTDVYTLGIILYEMLAGQRPYDTAKAAMAEAIRVICEEPPRPLRQSWSGIRRLDPDIETIVGRALEKEPDRRYASAAALSDDVARYLASQPILARPPSAVYQFRKFAQRRRGLLAAVAAVFLALAGGLVATSVMFVRARHSEGAAVASAFDARRKSYAANMRAAEISFRNGDLSEARTRLSAADEEFRGWEWGYLDSLSRGADLELKLQAFLGGSASLTFSDHGSHLIVGFQGLSPLSGPEVHIVDLALRKTVKDVALPPREPDGSENVAISRDGRFAVRHTNNEALLVDLSAPAAAARVLVAGILPGYTKAPGGLSAPLDVRWVDTAAVSGVDVDTTSFGPKGGRLAIGLSRVDRRTDELRLDRIEVFDTPGPQHVATLRAGRDGELWGLTLASGGGRIVAQLYEGHEPPTLLVWDLPRELPSVRILPTEDDGSFGSGMGFSDDGRLLVVPRERAVQLWDLKTAKVVYRYPTPALAHVTDLTGDHRHLAIGMDDGAVHLVELRAGDEPREGSNFPPSRRPTAHLLRSFNATKQPVLAVGFSTDERKLAALDKVGNLFVWPIEATPAGWRVDLPLLSLPVRVDTGVVPVGPHVLSVRDDGSLVTVELRTGRIVHDTKDQPDGVAGLLSFPAGIAVDGDGLLAAVPGRTVEVWLRDARNGRVIQTIDTTPGSKSVSGGDNLILALSPGGNELASMSRDGTVHVLDRRRGVLESLPESATLAEAEAAAMEDLRPTTPLLSPQGSQDERARHLSLEARILQRRVLRIGPEARHLAIGRGGRVALWDLDRKAYRPLESVSGANGLKTLCFSPDGGLLAGLVLRGPLLTGSEVLAVWDTFTGLLRQTHDLSLRGPNASNTVFSPDGRRLVVGWQELLDSSLLVLDTFDFTPLFSTSVAKRVLLPIGFTPDGERLAMKGGKPGVAFQWNLEVWESSRAPAAHVADASGDPGESEGVEDRVPESGKPAGPPPRSRPLVEVVWTAPPGAARDPGARATLRIGEIVYAFRWVPASTVAIGSPPDEPCRENGMEGPWTVTLPRGFWMGETEVTRALWSAVMGEEAGHFGDCGPECPVELVSWHDARDFARRLNAAAPGGSFRLPREAEWERAARAGTVGPFTHDCPEFDSGACAQIMGVPINRTVCVDGFAWDVDNAEGRIHPVARKRPNAWGLYDIEGNVAEWCDEPFSGPPAGTGSATEAPTAEGRKRVVRGGSFVSRAALLRAASREPLLADARAADVGFRILREVPGGEAAGRETTRWRTAPNLLAGVDLTGPWIGDYDGSMELVRVKADGDRLVATKMTGDGRVPAGQLAWWIDRRTLVGGIQDADEGFRNPRRFPCAVRLKGERELTLLADLSRHGVTRGNTIVFRRPAQGSPANEGD